MYVSMTSFTTEPGAYARPARDGFVRIGREPGGRLGSWTRTALLYKDAGCSDQVAQLHAVHLEAWDDDGIFLRGEERTWRRKDCTVTNCSWQISFRGMGRASVYRMRERGVRLPQEQVKLSTPMSGRVVVADGRHATLLDPVSVRRLGELHRLQIQHWDARGMMLAGEERDARDARGAGYWQSWYVKFPGAPAVAAAQRQAEVARVA
jgi:hypothetical protein